MSEALPIHDEDSEQRLLFVLLRCEDQSIRREIFQRVKREAWFTPQHADIAEACQACHDAGLISDEVFRKAVRDEMEKRGTLAGLPDGAAYLELLAHALPSGAGWPYYVERVIECWRRRWLDSEARSLAQAAATLDRDPVATARRLASRLTTFVSKATAASIPIESGSESLADQVVRASRGELRSVAWPWAMLTDWARALRPGTLTMLAGGAGDSKSLWLLEALITWIDRGYQASAWMLEETRQFYAARSVAQLARDSHLADPDWCGRNVSASMRAINDHGELLDRIDKSIKVVNGSAPTLDEIGDWVEARAASGDRIIIVDPVTRARTSGSRFNDDERVVDRIAAAAAKHAASVIVVTHPPKISAAARPSLMDLAGGAAWSRFAQSVFFMRRVEPVKRVRVIEPQSNLQINSSINREVHLLKCRSGPGTGKVIGFWFSGESLTFTECGVVLKQTKKETEEAAAEDGNEPPHNPNLVQPGA